MGLAGDKPDTELLTCLNPRLSSAIEQPDRVTITEHYRTTASAAVHRESCWAIAGCECQRPC
ncbi:hypothetical protein BZL30_2051 [Mycobacterium kansasii]|uniref:Uncharacterized protein n=1 Tax=Mycobacterium kansasii TaxID=1768 RepID=A0A1V3XPG8_MYCKA|nr:hypothetical protein BZL30_2051 [Mycobacterium kansasii]OOK80371.1 hypothetical protein BZL29_2071 [Mycobacterium kansasii]